MLPALAAAALWQESPEAFWARAQRALQSADSRQIEALFARRQDAENLIASIGRGGGPRATRVAVIPSPPGWEKTGPYWATFSRNQVIEQDHDPVYPLVRTRGGWQLGPELPEWDTDHVVSESWATATLHPARRLATIDARVRLRSKGRRAPVFRLNEPYTLDPGQGHLAASGPALAKPRPGQLVRAGGLLIPWTRSVRELRVRYRARFEDANDDQVNERAAYLSAYWIPDLARLPCPRNVTIVGPREWVLRSEGRPVPVDRGLRPAAGQKAASFRCDLPISYPKVMAGAYRVAAEKKVGRHTFRSYQFHPVDRHRGRQIVERLAKGMNFFEKRLAPFPFAGYEVFDANNYYGIESYSHTLLSVPISLRYATHEMGHTYFGGMAPCAYVRDTWNEGVTTYVDDVLFLGNVEETLRSGLETLRVAVPLSRMDVPYAHGGATYWRGCYAMRMLEREIGLESVWKGLRNLVTSRRGRDTVWADLRPIFERASGRDLKWFWAQWIDGAVFPKVEIAGFGASRRGRLVVRVRQNGTPAPFRLRFALVAEGAQEVRQEVLMDRAEQEFELPVESARAVRIDPLGMALVQAGPPAPVPARTGVAP